MIRHLKGILVLAGVRGSEFLSSDTVLSCRPGLLAGVVQTQLLRGIPESENSSELGVLFTGVAMGTA